MISVNPVIQTGLNNWHSTLPNELWGFPHGAWASATARMTHSFSNNNAFSIYPCKSAESTCLLLFVFLFAETFRVDSGRKDIIHKKPIKLNTLVKVTVKSWFLCVWMLLIYFACTLLYLWCFSLICEYQNQSVFGKRFIFLTSHQNILILHLNCFVHQVNKKENVPKKNQNFMSAVYSVFYQF